MASAKLQKPTNEEHKFSQKISEVTAWGSRVLGHKQQEHQTMAKHCTTCQCSAPKDTKPTSTAIQKKDHNNNISITGMKSGACTETKKKEKEHTTAVHKEAKHTTCIELKKKEKPYKTNVQTKDSKQPVCAEMKTNEKKEHHTKNNPLSKKERKDEPASHWFSGMGDHLKEKIMVMKKSKDGKHKDDSSSSDSDSVDESGGMIKKGKRHSQGNKTSSK